MSNVNLNSYKIFHEVVQSKSYAKASEKLYITVPAISTAITKLEGTLDTKLFYREKDGVILTEAGSELYELVNKGLSSLELAEKLMKKRNDLATGELTIGCLSHIATYYLMDYIEKARKDYPNLKIKLISGLNIVEMLEKLDNHKIDFIIDTSPIKNIDKTIIVEELKTVKNILISKEQIEIHELKEMETLKYIINFNYTNTTKELLETLNTYNIKIKPSMECDITELRVEAVKRNLGVGYVMQEAVKKELKNKEIYEVKIPIELPETKIKLIYMKNQLTRTDKQFIKKYLKNK